ncbi:MAG: lysylphosphatidylglycerol synthase transmembrane domain-containing protein [Anaerolineae bacterium]
MLKTLNATKERKTKITRMAKVGVSLALMAVIFYRIDLSEFVGLVKGADVYYLALAVGLVIGALILGAYRWQRLLIALGISVPLPTLISSYFVGLFFNNFLPTSMGGDVVRVYDVAKYSRQPSVSAASVIAERVLSSLAQGLIALVGLALGYDMARRFLAEITALFLVLCLVLLALLLGGRWARKLSLSDPFSLKSKVMGVLESISFCLRNKPLALWVIFVSLFFHGMIVLINYMIFKALNANVSLLSCFLVIPVILFITLLPISINGLGVREWAYIYFFGRLGLSMMESVAVSLLFFFLLTLVSLIGGVIFALRR